MKAQNSAILVLGLSKVEATDFPRASFFDREHGMVAIGSNLWRTENGGQTWEHRTLPTDRPLGLRLIQPGTAWLFAHEIFLTNDNGESWAKITNPFAGGRIYSLSVDSSGKSIRATGAIYGSIPTGPVHASNGDFSEDGKSVLRGTLAVSEDGGLSWGQNMDFGPGEYPTVVTAPNRETWVLCGMRIFRLEGSILRSSDLQKAGGSEWQRVVASAQAGETLPLNPTALTFLNGQIGWLSITNGFVLKTVDGGRSWVQLFDLSKALGPPTNEFFRYFQKMAFCASEVGWAIDGKHSLYITSNGGELWKKLVYDHEFYDLDCAHDGSVWAVGSNGVYRILQ